MGRCNKAVSDRLAIHGFKIVLIYVWLVVVEALAVRGTVVLMTNTALATLVAWLCSGYANGCDETHNRWVV